MFFLSSVFTLQKYPGTGSNIFSFRIWDFLGQVISQVDGASLSVPWCQENQHLAEFDPLL